jgi:hypothetical protein
VVSSEQELFNLASQDMPVAGHEVREAMSRWARELLADSNKQIAKLEVELALERKSVATLHEGLNQLFKEALQLRNENRGLKKRIKELEGQQ